jgi:hypothetical protein
MLARKPGLPAAAGYAHAYLYVLSEGILEGDKGMFERMAAFIL